MMAGRTSEARDVRVLVVDDSATMRGLIDRVVGQGPGLTVVGHAADAFEAADAVMELDPDVLTLDVEMPHVNGIHFLRQLTSLRPKPVVMVSARTRKGADTAV